MISIDTWQQEQTKIKKNLLSKIYFKQTLLSLVFSYNPTNLL